MLSPGLIKKQLLGMYILVPKEKKKEEKNNLGRKVKKKKRKEKSSKSRNVTLIFQREFTNIFSSGKNNE